MDKEGREVLDGAEESTGIAAGKGNVRNQREDDIDK